MYKLAPVAGSLGKPKKGFRVRSVGVWGFGVRSPGASRVTRRRSRVETGGIMVSGVGFSWGVQGAELNSPGCDCLAG